MDFLKLEKIIGVKFKNQDLLRQAFIHRSYLNENRQEKEHNERMEFLGDAVLELVTTEYLYKNFPNPEGELTSLRSSIVKRETLAETAKDLKLGDWLFLSRGEKASGGHEKDYILANTVEALIGAMYLENGYATCQKFIEKFIVAKLAAIMETGKHIDSKSLFQEKAQEIMNTPPEYKLIYDEGPDHNKTFTMGVYLGAEFVAQGKGASKQAAEQEAAKEALKFKDWQ